MKEIVLNRINAIKIRENDFNRKSSRWHKPLTHGTECKYADEIDFNKLSEHDLLFLFERILSRYYGLLEVD